jgi:phytanoyl-CoA hydroxylase
MYVFKNPSKGIPVDPHRDSSFLVTTPNTVQAIWTSIDYATKENGCLRCVPGSHKRGPNVMHKKTVDPTVGNIINVPHFNPENDDAYDMSHYADLEVSPGSVIMLKSNLLHWSEANKSQNSRNAFAIHMVEGDGSAEYDPGNWLDRINGETCKGREFKRINLE